MRNIFVALALAILTASSAVSSTSPGADSQQEQNKAVARRVFAEIFNQGRFDVADEIYARNFVNHGLHRDFNLQQDQAAARWEKQTAPDLTITVDLMMAEGDLVTVVWTARGTNTASIGWLPATGVKIEERGITVWRIVDGKISEEWTSFDILPLVREFVSQMKWRLIGLLCVVILLVWTIGRLLRRLWLNFSAPTA